MAQKTITQRIAFEGGPEMELALRQIGDTGQVAFKRLKEAADNASGFGPRLLATIETVKARLDALSDSIGHAHKSIDEFGKKAKEVGENVLIAAAAVGAAGAAFFELVNSSAEAADKLAKTAGALGITTQQLQGLVFVARQAGLNVDQLSKGLIKLVSSATQTEKTQIGLRDQIDRVGRSFFSGKISLDQWQDQLREMAKNATTATDPLTRLGVAIRGTDGKLKNSFDLLLDVAEAFKQSTDEGLKTQVLFEAFGSRTGTRFADALDKGRVGIQDMIKEQERIAPAFTKSEIAIGVKFSDALDRTSLAVASLKNSFGLLFAEPFTRFFDTLTEVIAANRTRILQLGATISNYLTPILADLIHLLEGKDIDPNGVVGKIREALIEFGATAIQVIGIVSSAWDGLVSVMNVVAKAINFVFGTSVSGKALAVIAILGVVSGAFAAIGAAITAILAVVGVFDAVLVVAFGPEGALLVGLALMGAAIGALIVNIPLVKDAFNALAEGFTGTVNNFITLFKLIGAEWQLLWQDAGKFFTDVADSVLKYFQGVIDKISDAINLVKTFFGASGGNDNSSGSGNAGGFKSGGKVNGPGSSRSDSILARLSNGEFVHQAPAVQFYGERFMHALNQMQIPRGVVDGLAGFANGGMVRSMASMLPVPGFASGGMVKAGDLGSISGGGGRPLVLNIGGENFTGLRAEDGTADRLARFATRQSIQSAGRKPSWDR